IQLERNPAWSASSDPIRPANVDRIIVTLGIDQQLTQLQIAAGTADLSFDMAPPTSETASLLEIGDRNLLLSPPGDYYAGMSYLAINTVGPNNEGALKNAEVREPLQQGVTKAAASKSKGGCACRVLYGRRYRAMSPDMKKVRICTKRRWTREILRKRETFS